MSWRLMWPNFAKSYSMASTMAIAIGSLMMPSVRRASLARTASVNSAVSDTPDSTGSILSAEWLT